MTLKEVQRVMKSEVQLWGSDRIPIKLNWGLRNKIEVDVSVIYPFSSDSNITTQYQSKIDGNGRPKLLRTQCPLLGMPFEALKSLQDQYSNYVRDFVQSEADLTQYAHAAYIGANSEVPGHLLPILCAWYNENKRNGKECLMLREVLETHVICSLIDRSFLLDQESYDNARKQLKHEFPRHAAPNLVQRQLKYIFFQGQQKRIISVLKSWGKSIRQIDKPSSTLWTADFCVLSMLCLIMDVTISSAYELHVYRMETHRETNDRELRNLAGTIEEELFQKAKEIFHLRHRTRRGGRESYNPLRDGIDPHGSGSGGLDWWSAKLMNDVRQLVLWIGLQTLLCK